MSISRRLREYLDGLKKTPTLELGKWARFVRFQVQLWRFCARRLWENNVMAMSAAMSFRTIFALIPILVLGLVMLKSVGALEARRAWLDNLLATSGFQQITLGVEEPVLSDEDLVGPMLPLAAEAQLAEAEPAKVVNVADEIEKLVAGVESKLTLGRIGPVGIVLLVWSAMTLVGTMERSLNRIFDVHRSRSLGRRVVLYWSAVTLGPLLVSTAAYLGQQVVNLSAGGSFASWVLAGFGWMGPIIVGAMFIASLYKILPNTHVSWKSALGGAVAAVPVWLVAKWGFAIYVSKISTGTLYGALGLLPVFLIWLNFSWWIFLFGAQLAYTGANLEQYQSTEMAQETVLTAADLLAAAVAVAEPYSCGKGPVSFTTLEASLRLPNASIDSLLDRLKTNGIVCAVDESPVPRFVLAKPPEKIAVLGICELDELPPASTRSTRYTTEVAARVDRLRQHAKSSLGNLTLADLLKSQ